MDIYEVNWKKLIKVTRKGIICKTTGEDITKKFYFRLNGQNYMVRRIAFFLIHNRWPRGLFLLPWESDDPHLRR